ncbi:Vacuolar amino acid transporter 1 [Morella rubra]|uniref:Vacuolar amino acid transporter 1 n=1 Tax=Morella rubra TaxID=262757 RepID=A0A6A1VFU3_9ROSI|nr:Vacuolar amino acid transporter 1 [Morella rubra]
MAKLSDDSSLSVPLILDEKQNVLAHKLEELESNFCHSSTTTVSFFKTCFNGLNALSGVGILSVPYALSSGGWVSLILLFVIAIAAFYSGLLMKRCMDMDSGIRTYPDIGHRAFGNKGRVLVSVTMYTELYLVATGFLILEGDNLNNLFPNAGFEMAGITIGGKQLFVIIVALIILPSVWLDNLSLLSYVSASGVLASVIILCSIMWTGAFDGIGFQQKGIPLNWNGIPTAVSLYAFCYCAHPVFPTLYTSMGNKRQFTNVLLLCFTLCTVSYASMAVFGYLMFGSHVQSQITLNLPIDKLSSRVAIYTTLVNPIAKYALMVTPIVNATKSWSPRHYNKRIFSLLISTSLVISTVIVALAIPFFADLMSLVGAFLSVSASIIMPCLCYLKISGAYRRFGVEMAVLWGIILMGVAVALVGTYTSLTEIIGHLKAGEIWTLMEGPKTSISTSSLPVALGPNNSTDQSNYQLKDPRRRYESQSFERSQYISSEETQTTNVDHGRVYRRHNYNPPSEHPNIKFDESECDEEMEMEEPPSRVYPPLERPPPSVPLYQDKHDSAVGVHPKLPDYDALAARFEALKYRKH